MADRYKLLIDSMNGVVWEANRATMELNFISENVFQLLGYTSADCLNEKSFWSDIIFTDDKTIVANFLQSATQQKNSNCEFRVIRADGRIAHIKNHTTSVYTNGVLTSICGLMIDVSHERLMEQLEHLEKEVLELNATPNTEIENILKYYVIGLERIFPTMKCSILRIQDGKAFNWASPSLPAKYISDIDGLTIGLNTGSCGTAAFLGQKVIVSDIEHDEKWADYRDFALVHNLRACWSQPIINSMGVVMATFALYYDVVKIPNEDELAFIDRSAAILRIIMENKLYAKAIVEMNNMAAQGQQLANFGTWQWDFNSHDVIWSDTLYRIFGLDPLQFHPSYEGYLQFVHPEDREKVRQILDAAHEKRKDVTFEERIIRPDGSIRYLKSWFRVLTNVDGKPIKFIGASLDVTQATVSKIKMANIAWQQSHVVRAPLARIMSLVSLLYEGRLSKDDIEKNQLFEMIMNSAHELDGVIREINDNTVVSV